jgi:3'(2'), 5'-bisphosphate nucleotidase
VTPRGKRQCVYDLGGHCAALHLHVNRAGKARPEPMNILDQMLAAAIAASEVILEVYERDVVAERKPDGSPVTEADSRAEAIILERLAPIGLPILAEESVAAGRIPELGARFFVVDPLDGTREFLKRNGEFTVNIALCEAGRPILGVVIAPVSGASYWGGEGEALGGTLENGAIHGHHRITTDSHGPLRIVASRSHGHPAIRALCEKMQVVAGVSVGSSLKFGLLATGAAQLYPRFGPTSEWDTAAGQAVLEAAGGVVLNLEGAPLTCGHADRKFLNGPFVAAASPALAHTAIAEIRRLSA